LQPLDAIKDADAVILAVMHKVYRKIGLEGISRLCTDSHAPFIDVKGCFSPQEAQKLGLSYWRL
jgi:UDP-N-acetyl-D-galactosamine dehydrogenase